MKAKDMRHLSNVFDKVLGTCRVLYQMNLRNSASRWLSLQEYPNFKLNLSTYITSTQRLPRGSSCGNRLNIPPRSTCLQSDVGGVCGFCGLNIQTAVDWVYRVLIWGHKLSAFRTRWCKVLYVRFLHKRSETHASRYREDLFKIQHPQNVQDRILRVITVCLSVAGTYTCSRKHTQVWRLTPKRPHATSALHEYVEGITGANPQLSQQPDFIGTTETHEPTHSYMCTTAVTQHTDSVKRNAAPNFPFILHPALLLRPTCILKSGLK